MLLIVGGAGVTDVGSEPAIIVERLRPKTSRLDICSGRACFAERNLSSRSSRLSLSDSPSSSFCSLSPKRASAKLTPGNVLPLYKPCRSSHIRIGLCLRNLSTQGIWPTYEFDTWCVSVSRKWEDKQSRFTHHKPVIQEIFNPTNDAKYIFAFFDEPMALAVCHVAHDIESEV